MPAGPRVARPRGVAPVCTGVPSSMRTLRPFLRRAAIVLFAAAVVAAGAVAVAADDGLARVVLADDFASVTGYAPDGAEAFRFTIEAWRAWAVDHLAAGLGGPVTIGGVELEVSTFQSFGFADVVPGGRRALLVATTYAMLTTASVFTVLDPRTGDVAIVADVAYGDVEELAWSPDGRFVAYTLGSARAGGDALHVDDLKERLRVLELDAHAALATDAGDSLEAVVDGFGWFPGFRGLAWHDDGSLTFVSHDPSLGFEEGEVRWRFDRARGEPTVD